MNLWVKPQEVSLSTVEPKQVMVADELPTLVLPKTKLEVLFQTALNYEMTNQRIKLLEAQRKSFKPMLEGQVKKEGVEVHRFGYPFFLCLNRQSIRTLERCNRGVRSSCYYFYPGFLHVSRTVHRPQDSRNTYSLRSDRETEYVAAKEHDEG